MFELLLGAAAHTATSGFGSPADMWNAIVTDFSNITEPAAFAALGSTTGQRAVLALGVGAIPGRSLVIAGAPMPSIIGIAAPPAST